MRSVLPVDFIRWDNNSSRKLELENSCNKGGKKLSFCSHTSRIMRQTSRLLATTPTVQLMKSLTYIIIVIYFHFFIWFALQTPGIGVFFERNQLWWFDRETLTVWGVVTYGRWSPTTGTCMHRRTRRDLDFEVSRCNGWRPWLMVRFCSFLQALLNQSFSGKRTTEKRV